MDNLIEKVGQWSTEKRLDHADSFKQFAKVAEEFCEIAA